MLVFTLRRAAIFLFLCCVATIGYGQQQPNENLKAIRQVERSLQLPITPPDAVPITVTLQPADFIGESVRRQFPDLHVYRVTTPGVTGTITINGDRLLGDLNVGDRWLQNTGTDADGNFILSAAGKEDPQRLQPAVCGNEAESASPWMPAGKTTTKSIGAPFTSGAIKRSYRFAVITTGEFFEENGEDEDEVATLVAQTVAFNNMVYENDLSVTLILAELAIRTSVLNDEFTPNKTSTISRTQQAGQAINQAFDAGNYDVGMVFHNTAGNNDWSSGGVAQLRSVCQNQLYDDGSILKGYGWSGSPVNTTTGWRRLVTHELGHMFGASHTFNGSGASCTKIQQSKITSVEIGSGTTLMSYAGICDSSQNVPFRNLASSYFHQVSVEQMLAIININDDCAQASKATNALPVVDASPCTNDGFIIPLSTPFRLDGEATDSDLDDALTYAWEQLDEDGNTSNVTQGATLTQTNAAGLTADQLVDAPLFLSTSPRGESFRNFPDNQLGQSTEFEVLPGIARTMTFGLVVRDNHPGGGAITTDLLTVDVSPNGPLLFTGPATTEALVPGDEYRFEWNTNNTDELCAIVNIEMSTNGGDSYAYILGEADYATAFADLTLPATVPNGNNVRFRIVCTDNPCQTFFAVDQELRTIDNQACMTADTEITPVSALTTTAGSSEANLDLAANLGGRLPSRFTLSGALSQSSADFVDQLIYSSGANNTGCSTQSLALAIDRYTIVPTTNQPGTDVLVSMSYSGNYFPVINVYEETFDPSNACATWVASNLYRPADGEPARNDLRGLILTSNQRYVITVTPNTYAAFYDFPTEYDLTISVADGTVLTDNYAQPADYTYTFAAVNEASQRIAAVSEEADFTSLTGGRYQIYGVNYAETEPTDKWIGQTLSSVVSGSSGDDCIRLSDNSRSLTIQGNQVAAPVEWLSFSGRVDASDLAVLDWSVAAEVDNDYFTVDRSDDGQDWQPVGQVSGRGTDPTFGSYQFTDPAPLSGPTYYRLTQIDFDGSADYSEIVSLDVSGATILVAYPNPFTDELRVTTASISDELPTVHDIHGRNVGHQLSVVRESDRVLRLGMSSLPTGIYLLQHGGSTVRLIKR